MPTSYDHPWFVYILTNRPYGTLYTGSTNDLRRRTYEHKLGAVPGFTKRYGLRTLVWFEQHATMADARHREWLIKRWRRAWKIELIVTDNPRWDDLFDDLGPL
jgi:putative endonuclease